MEENYVWIIISAVTAVIAVFILLVTLRARKKKTEDYFKENLRKVIRDEAIARALNNYSGSETASGEAFCSDGTGYGSCEEDL